MLRRDSTLTVMGNILPLLFLGIMLLYTYAKFLGHPYGFRWESSTGVIRHVFDRQPEPTLKEGDQLLQIGDVTWEDFDKDLQQPFFVGAKPGDVIPIVVARQGQIIKIDWVFPAGPSRPEILDQLISEWFIAYFFWLAGFLTALSIRPRNGRWLLMLAFCFLTALWLIVGSGTSGFQIWNGALILRIVIWLCVPLYLHLHWVFPRPLRPIPAPVVWAAYGIGIALAIAQGFQRLPKSLYIYGFLIAVGGSLIILLLHAWRQPAVRRDLRLMLIVAILALVVPLLWQLYVLLTGVPLTIGSFGLLTFALLPFAYLYAAYRRQLGRLELRLNRIISISLFLILLGMILLTLLALAEYTVNFPEKTLIVGFLSAVLTAAAFIWGYPHFENFVERGVFGIPLHSKDLLEVYSNRITTSDSLPALVRVIDHEIIPSLLIRQFVFLQAEDGSIRVLSKTGVNEEQIPTAEDLPDLINRAGTYLSPDLMGEGQFNSWIRLILPLKLGEETIGFWLFGRRDPDDMYSQKEIPIVKSLANQTAVALSNLLQTERLKTMYEANIDRYEQEKQRLSLDLHDSILNELAALLMRDDAAVFSPGFQQAFEALTERLREIVSDLRPPTLNFGLKVALEDVADKLSERNPGNAKLIADIQAEEQWRYPEKVENHLYRIVQEACENALKYAQANTIRIVARLEQARIDIRIEDDGVGFNSETSLKLDTMLAQKHFGLAGMHERAHLIGAEVHVHSKPGEGTRIQVIWEAKSSI